MRWVCVAALCTIVAACASCATAPVRGTEEVTPEGAPVDSTPRLVAGYLLSVLVSVGGETEIDVKNRRIRSDGTIEVPLLGAVPCEGMTLSELGERLRKLYDVSYFVDPQVSVEFVLDDKAETYPWGYVTVLGRVKEPGRVAMPPTRDLSLTQAIQKVGGLDRYARESRIEITRDEGGKLRQIPADLREVASSGGKDVRLRSGDVIFVPEVVF
jgi:polysaccharide export outer membrane protein